MSDVEGRFEQPPEGHYARYNRSAMVPAARPPLNSNITDAPIVLFVGAGASAGFAGKTMRQLTEAIVHALAQPQEPDRHEFLSMIGTFEKERGGPWDVEDLLTWIEEKRPGAQSLRRIYFEIGHHCSDVNERLAHDQYNWLLRLLSDGEHFLPIFTTNYDWAFEQLARLGPNQVIEPLIDGFTLSPVHGAVWNPEVFAQAERLETKPTAPQPVALFKLHGSTSWYQGNFAYPMPWAIKMGGNFQVGSAVRGPLGPLGFLESMAIFPGHGLRKMLDAPPFRVGRAYLADCLSKCRVLVVIGYSFRDDDINQTINEGIQRRSGKQLHIIVVDPEPGNISTHFLKGINVRLQAITGHLADSLVQEQVISSVDGGVAIDPARLTIVKSSLPRSAE